MTAHAKLLARVLGSAVLACCLLFSWVPIGASAAGSLAGKTIVIDPGHGGVDSGAVANGIEEKNITLPIGLDLGALLQQQGARVVYTRTTDTTVGPPNDVTAGLAARARLANSVHADIFIAIHGNATNDPGFSGVMTFYGTASGYVDNVKRSPALEGQSRLLAEDIQRAVQQQTNEIDRGVHAADFYVLGNTDMPSILIEAGFITNPAEAQRLKTPSYQQTIASGIAAGVDQFFHSVGTPIRQATDPNNAHFIADVTYPDHSIVPAGGSIVKSWQVVNTGGTAWNSSDSLKLEPGGNVQAPATIPLPDTAPGATATISVPVQVGPKPGIVSATWRFIGPNGHTFGEPLWLLARVPAAAFNAYWVEATRDVTLWTDPNTHADPITRLGQWSFLQVISAPVGDRLHVKEPASGRAGYVAASAVGPTGPPPANYVPPPAIPPFQPFWVETTAAAPLVSSPIDPSVAFGTVPQWSFLQVIAPPAGPRLYVRNPTTGGTAYVAATAVGPSGPPSGPAEAVSPAVATPSTTSSGAGASPTSATGVPTAVSDTGTTPWATGTTAPSGGADPTLPSSSPVATSADLYIVQSGDTLYSVARQHHVTAATLIALNHLTDPNRLAVGQQLRVSVFTSFWVENFVPTALWSGTDRSAVQFGIAPLWSPMQVLEPALQNRYMVRDWNTGGVAFVDTTAVGPAGPPKGAQ